MNKLTIDKLLLLEAFLSFKILLISTCTIHELQDHIEEVILEQRRPVLFSPGD